MFRFAYQLMPEIDGSPGRIKANFPEIDGDEFWTLYDATRSFSLLNITAFYNLWQSARYVARAGIPGDVIECGCFLGGAVAFLYRALKHFGAERRFILFDTFEGPPLDARDTVFGTEHRGHKLPDFESAVRRNLSDCEVDVSAFTFIRGRVEETLPRFTPPPLSILRLDTDFYESTRDEFRYLYPSLVSGGVLIVDDYGLFRGSRRATDDYLDTLPTPPLLNRIDIGVWAGVKP
jgi:hypothetical protein